MATATEAPASTTAEGPTSHTQNQDRPSIYELMALVMNDVRDVGKNGFNNHHKYAFRGVDDFIGALAQPLRKHGVFMMTEILDFETSVRGSMNAVHLRVAFHFYGPAGDKVTATTLGEASDTADKASNKAMSAALKYALMQTFMIPVDAGSLDDGDRDHPVGQRSPADAYMERLQKPAVWNNVGALTAMHAEAKADGLLEAEVHGPNGKTTLEKLIVSRGTALKQEIAEREQRKATEAPAVAAQIAAETGGGTVVVDPASFVPHPDGQDFANQAALATSREAVENIRSNAGTDGIGNSGVLAPDSGQPDVLSAYLERRVAELAPEGEDPVDGFVRRMRNGWRELGPTRMALAEAKQKGLLTTVIPFDNDHLMIKDVLGMRIKALEEQAAQANAGEGTAA
ncbi:ERF family protein [Streptomyces sp. NBC_01483]|uniref:ERF family protein n=1 Tax=Streptomyces sp. NBC_01483 TaxID=2903883 RepID=UPI002E312458|nr:ERF family protein [Streptomyces sp. NBC_01483]